jgi:hypothetical protein
VIAEVHYSWLGLLGSLVVSVITWPEDALCYPVKMVFTFHNRENRVYGTLFRVVGEAASQVQFFLTDSTDHFLVGSLYFYTRPNYDSLMPAAQYVENDLMRLMESFEWKGISEE